MSLFSYKIVRDFGFAPNPFFGFCTLAACKPQIRKGAEVGDLIVGSGGLGHCRPNRVIFAMRVSEKLTFNQYWHDERFAKKKPNLESSWMRAYGDNIYHQTDGGDWLQADSHHSYGDGGLNLDNRNRDIGCLSVLIGNDFAYFGSDAIPIPEQLQPFENDYLFPRGRNYRNSYSLAFENAANEWFESLPKGRRSLPSDWKHLA